MYKVSKKWDRIKRNQGEQKNHVGNHEGSAGQ